MIAEFTLRLFTATLAIVAVSVLVAWAVGAL